MYKDLSKERKKKLSKSATKWRRDKIENGGYKQVTVMLNADYYEKFVCVGIKNNAETLRFLLDFYHEHKP